MEKTTSMLEKTFLVLENLDGEEMSLNDITKKNGLKKPTIYRILNQLIKIGYVNRVKDKYHISLKFLTLARSVFHAKGNIIDIARKFIIDLRDTYSESVNLVLWDKQSCILIDTQPSKQAFRVEDNVGDVFPIYKTAVGKAIAAYLPWETTEEILKKAGMEKSTENTITRIEDFKKEIKMIRERGSAEDNEEIVIGTKCIAVPIFNSKNIIYGALGIVAPISRITAELALQISKDLQIAGHRISFEISLSNIDK